MTTELSSRNSPWIFFLLVLLLSVPFWLTGPIVEKLFGGPLLIKLPISALWLVNPLVASIILTSRESGSEGVKHLLSRALDWRKIRQPFWYVPIFLLWPVMMVLAFDFMLRHGAPLPHDPMVPYSIVPLFF